MEKWFRVNGFCPRYSVLQISSTAHLPLLALTSIGWWLLFKVEGNRVGVGVRASSGF
jgi:hypothetical protein